MSVEPIFHLKKQEPEIENGMSRIVCHFADGVKYTLTAFSKKAAGEKVRGLNT